MYISCQLGTNRTVCAAGSVFHTFFSGLTPAPSTTLSSPGVCFRPRPNPRQRARSIYPQLFIAIIGYASVGTFVTTRLGGKLVGLNFEQLQTEADFR